MTMAHPVSKLAHVPGQVVLKGQLETSGAIGFRVRRYSRQKVV